MTDERGNIVWAASYDPWGNVREEFNPGNIRQDIRLPGQHQDRHTGLYYNRHRYYDPKLGTYINQDPIGLEGGNNLSNYVGNPNQWIDSLGLNGWMSVPIFNPSMPGNQAALSSAIDLSKCGGNCGKSDSALISDETLKWWGIPTNQGEWADYLSHQSDIFGVTSTVMAAIPAVQTVAWVPAVISSAADAGAKMLKPPPLPVHYSDTVLDIASANMPGGYWKDVGFTVAKKIYAEEAEKAFGTKSNGNMCTR